MAWKRLASQLVSWLVAIRVEQQLRGEWLPVETDGTQLINLCQCKPPGWRPLAAEHLWRLVQAGTTRRPPRQLPITKHARASEGRATPRMASTRLTMSNSCSFQLTADQVRRVELASQIVAGVSPGKQGVFRLSCKRLNF